MVLYYALSTYQILGCILHKLEYHRDDEAILLISDVHILRNDFKSRIKSTKIFKKVEIISDKVIKRNVLKVGTEASYISSIARNVRKKTPIDFNKITEFNIYLDHWPLGLYLMKNSVSYNFFVDGSGMFSKLDYTLDLIKKVDEKVYSIAKNYKLVGRNSLVNKIYVDLGAEPSCYKGNEKLVDFNLDSILRKLDVKIIKAIFRIFNVDNICIDQENTALVLTQNYINLGRMEIEEQRRLYEYLVGYFCNDSKLYIKPHPFDFQANYSNWFVNATVIPKEVPSELLSFMITKKIDIGLTASSTSIHNLRNYMNRTISFTPEIEKRYKLINKYYTALKVSSELISRFRIKADSVYECLFNMLIQYSLVEYSEDILNSLESKDESKPIIYIIDNFLNRDDKYVTNILEVMNEVDLAIFIDECDIIGLTEHLSREEFLKCTILPIEIIETSKDMVESYCMEEILLYSNDMVLIENIKSMSFIKELKACRKQVLINCFYDDSELQSLVYESMINSLSLRISELDKRGGFVE